LVPTQTLMLTPANALARIENIGSGSFSILKCKLRPEPIPALWLRGHLWSGPTVVEVTFSDSACTRFYFNLPCNRITRITFYTQSKRHLL